MNQTSTSSAQEKSSTSNNLGNNQIASSSNPLIRLFCFLSLTDYHVLQSCGDYDRTLVYAMVLRQLVTFAFTCLLFSFGVSQFLSLTAAIIVGVIFALALFFLDQAIIGSDWALKSPFKQGIPIKSLLSLVPRIVYSLIIAIGLATLAEISLQADAIDEQIQKQSQAKNKIYFDKLDSYQQELETAIAIERRKLESLQGEIDQLREAIQQSQSTNLSSDTESLSNKLAIELGKLTQLQDAHRLGLQQITTLNNQLAQTRQDYDFWFNEAILERTGRDGRPPTEGPKYDRAVASYTDLQQKMANLEAELIITQEKLDKQQLKIDTTLTNTNQLREKIERAKSSTSALSQNKQTLAALEQQLLTAKLQLSASLEQKQLKMDDYRKKLEKDGLFYQVKTGILRRYIALKRIHQDPEIGQAAFMFSWLLKLFFIAIELMPVIIKLFFSPFSFYSLKMYRKMQLALHEEKRKLELATRADPTQVQNSSRLKPDIN